MTKIANIDRARATAFHVAEVNKLTVPEKPCRYDTDFPNKPRCYLAMENPKLKCAIVVYEDNPKTVVSTGWSPTRFVIV